METKTKSRLLLTLALAASMALGVLGGARPIEGNGVGPFFSGYLSDESDIFLCAVTPKQGYSQMPEFYIRKNYSSSIEIFLAVYDESGVLVAIITEQMGYTSIPTSVPKSSVYFLVVGALPNYPKNAVIGEGKLSDGFMINSQGDNYQGDDGCWYLNTMYTELCYDLSPAYFISGPSSMALPLGYSAASSAQFFIWGYPHPWAIVDGPEHISWNSDTDKLDIAPGLGVGSYEVKLTFENYVRLREMELLEPLVAPSSSTTDPGFVPVQPAIPFNTIVFTLYVYDASPPTVTTTRTTTATTTKTEFYENDVTVTATRTTTSTATATVTSIMTSVVTTPSTVTSVSSVTATNSVTAFNTITSTVHTTADGVTTTAIITNTATTTVETKADKEPLNNLTIPALIGCGILVAALGASLFFLFKK